jgi:uncharacterized protein (DUF934 family)
LKDGVFALAEDPSHLGLRRLGDPAGRCDHLAHSLPGGGRPAALRKAARSACGLEADEEVEALAYDLPRLSVVALVFRSSATGRAYSYASLLRERFNYQGEIRAVGDVLREQAGFMVRCGFDAFEPADGSTPEDWERAAHRFRHVYQRSTDAAGPRRFVERGE